VTDTSIEPLLREVSRLLDAERVAHMVVGSFASTTYGVVRTTFDLDLVIDPSTEQLDRFVTALDVDRFYVDRDAALDAFRRRSMFNVIDMTSAWKLDLIVRKARPFSIEELARRRIATLFGMQVPMATAEDTILAKLEWAHAGSSERQLDDVAGILDVRGNELDLAYIERWLDELGVRDLWDRVRAQVT
jgi:hypothetical protein